MKSNVLPVLPLLRANLLTLLLWGLGIGVYADEGLILSEICAVNDDGPVDEDRERVDWIEIHNRSTSAVQLKGYYLTDSKKKEKKWAFPDITIEGSAFLVVCASGKDRARAGRVLHTNFKLSRNGEFLALRSPRGAVDTVTYPRQFDGGSYGRVSNRWGYARTPTPGRPNLVLVQNDGPVVRDVKHAFIRVRETASVRVTASVSPRQPSQGAITADLHYRVMFGGFKTVMMRDDGGDGDRERNDGIYTAVLPAEELGKEGFQEGRLIQYYVTATGGDGKTQSREPLYASSRSVRFFGAMLPRESASKLPTLHWFAEKPEQSATRTGTSASLIFAGEYYDNVRCRVRGGTSTMWEKKSFKFHFRKDQRFVLDAALPRVSEINLNTTVQDKAYMREALAYELYRDAGVPAPLAYNVRVERNGEFYCLSTLVEQVDEQFLKRNHLSRGGLLYKVRDSRPSVMDIDRKSGSSVDDSEILELFSRRKEKGEVEAWLFERIDLPAMVNYLAAGTVMRDWDRPFHNYYLYRNPEGKWTMIPWDKDLTLGEHWRGDSISGDGEFGHPFYGGYGSGKAYNPIFDAIYSTPGTRQMYLRRLRTLMDQQLQQAPTSPSRRRAFEKRIDGMAENLVAEAKLDLEKWGSRVVSQQPRYIEFPEAVRQLKETFLTERRLHLYESHGPGTRTGIPPAQRPLNELRPLVEISWNAELLSVSVENLSPRAIDLTGFRIAGPKTHRFAPGTILAANGLTGSNLELSSDDSRRSRHVRLKQAVPFVQKLDEQEPARASKTGELFELERDAPIENRGEK